MQGHATTMGLFAKVGPLPDDSFRAFAMINESLTYDDGDDELTYVARTGAQMTAFMSSSDLGVDNAEMDSLPPVSAFALEGFTTEQIQSGVLDKTPYVVYCLNYRDTSMGHFIWSGGTIGEVRIKGTSLINLEQRSLSNQLKQSIGDVDSTTCRAKRLGTQYIGTVGAIRGVERFPCRYDVSVEIIPDIVVTAVDVADSDMTFTASALTQDDNYFAPGSVIFNTGANADIEREIESFAGGVITLAFATPHPIAEDDEFDIQRECTKKHEGHNSCQTFHGAEWVNRIRAEPWIPVGDAAINSVGGAGVAGDIGGTGE